MQTPPNIPDADMRACLQDRYGLAVGTLEFLPLGLDTRAGVFRAVSAGGDSYLIKVKSGPFYELSCRVPRYLRDHGSAAVVAPLPTRDNALWCNLGAWTLMLFPFIEGVCGWEPDLTAAQWQDVGRACKQMHQVPLPAAGYAGLRQETFDPSEYSRWFHTLASQYIPRVSQNDDEQQQTLRATWLAHQATIQAALTSLEKLAGVLRTRALPHVICHADLHPGNLIRDPADHVFIVDWDDVMLAPKERDFIFVGDAPAAETAVPAPFFQGYALPAIDWYALTYYLWERLVQDVIECARNVLLRPELSEVTKHEETRIFQNMFTAGGMAAIHAAAAHLPDDLRFSEES